MSLSIRSTTSGSHAIATENMINLHKEVNSINQEVASGKRVSVFSDVAEKTNISSFLYNKNALEGHVSQLKSNQLLDGRLGAVEAALRAIYQIYESVKQLAISAEHDTPGSVREQSRQFLASLETNLNANFNGSYLFSGNEIKTPPVEGIVDNTNIVDGVVTGNYYQGDEASQMALINDDFLMDYGVKADDEGFKNLIAGLHDLIAGDYAGGQDKIDIGGTRVEEMVSRLGNNVRILHQYIEYDSRYELELETRISEFEDTDLSEAMTRLFNTKTQLEALYMLMARLNSMSIVEYIR